MEARIPARIIHIYSAPVDQPEELPLFNRAALANSRLLHPNFDHVFFGRREMEDFLTKEFPQFRDVMASFPQPIQRFDFFRYLAVYRLGGFYFDLDVFLAKSLKPLLNYECIFAFEELTISNFLRQRFSLDWELANYGFGAAPGNPFLAAVIGNCIRGLHEPAWAQRMLQDIPRLFRAPFVAPFTTGPGAVSRTFAENPELRRNVTVLFPGNVCNQTTWHQFGDFGVHLMQSSWRKKEGLLRRRAARWWENFRRSRQVRLSNRLGPARSGEWRSLFPAPPT
jgi:hypothetical protein